MSAQSVFSSALSHPRPNQLHGIHFQIYMFYQCTFGARNGHSSKLPKSTSPIWRSERTCWGRRETLLPELIFHIATRRKIQQHYILCTGVSVICIHVYLLTISLSHTHRLVLQPEAKVGKTAKCFSSWTACIIMTNHAEWTECCHISFKGSHVCYLPTHKQTLDRSI